MPDLISCEVCGMHWTPRPHELCPRCALGCALEDRDSLAEKIATLERHLSEAREDADKGWAMARGNREWSMRERVEDKRTIEELVEANRIADAALERVEKELDTSKSLLAAANERAERDRDVFLVDAPHCLPEECPTFYDGAREGCHCTVSALRAVIANADEDRARVADLEGALREVQTALQRFSCEHDLVCADPACREAGHEHEGYGEDWYCAEYCPCVPACAGFEPDTCPGSRIVSEVIEKIGAELTAGGEEKNHG